MSDVMALTKPRAAAGKATALIAVVQRPSEGRRDRSRSRADLRCVAILIVPHDDPACVARQALRRFSGNAGAVENRVTSGIGIRQHDGIDVDHDLVAFSGRAGVHTVVERRLRDQGESIGLLLAPCRRVTVDEQSGATVSGRRAAG